MSERRIKAHFTTTKTGKTVAVPASSPQNRAGKAATAKAKKLFPAKKKT